MALWTEARDLCDPIFVGVGLGMLRRQLQQSRSFLRVQLDALRYGRFGLQIESLVYNNKFEG
jgi:hypothetical protein